MSSPSVHSYAEILHPSASLSEAAFDLFHPSAQGLCLPFMPLGSWCPSKLSNLMSVLQLYDQHDCLSSQRHTWALIHLWFGVCFPWAWYVLHSFDCISQCRHRLSWPVDYSCFSWSELKMLAASSEAIISRSLSLFWLWTFYHDWRRRNFHFCLHLHLPWRLFHDCTWDWDFHAAQTFWRSPKRFLGTFWCHGRSRSLFDSWLRCYLLWLMVSCLLKRYHFHFQS